MKLKNLLILLSCAILIASCKGRGLFGKKKYDKSEMTGWNYDDKDTYDSGNDRIFQQYTFGTSFNVGFTYRLGK